MAVSLNDYINTKFDITSKDIRTYSPLTLAYIGDAVYDLVIRSVLVNRGNTAVNNLHKKAVIGFLYLKGDTDRALELIKLGLERNNLNL